MIKLLTHIFIITVLFFSCKKSQLESTVILSDASMQMRNDLTEKGYNEVITIPIIKEMCYFEEWDKEVETPVSGLIEYHDSALNWIASIDFGNGDCDQWATKSWNSRFFPEYPEGEERFSVFKFVTKKSNK